MVATVALNCLVHGENPIQKVFDVTISIDSRFIDLKKLIKDEKNNALRDIKHHELVLWKVNIPSKTLSKLDQNFDYTSYGDVELSSLDEIRDFFPKSPARKNLHIVVIRSATTTDIYQETRSNIGM